MANMEYMNQYEKENLRQIRLKINRKTEPELLEWIEKQENIQGYIKGLILEDMKGEKNMTEKFAKKVISEGIVDTKNYRYIAKEINGPENQRIEIQRIKLSSLDTTDAIDGWETVKTID